MPHKALALEAPHLFLLLKYYQKEKRVQKFRPEEKMKLQNSQKVAGQGDDGNEEVACSGEGDRNTKR